MQTESSNGNDGSDKNKKIELNTAQRYVKLTRALVLSRILQGATELDGPQREKIETQLQEIRSQLAMNFQEFQQALQNIEQNPGAPSGGKSLESSDLSTHATEEEIAQTRTAFCINRQCRHKFTVKIQLDQPIAKICPICRSMAMFSLD